MNDKINNVNNSNSNSNNNESGKEAQMSETVKQLVEEYRELNTLPVDERGLALATVCRAVIRENDPVLVDGKEWDICITAEGLLYGRGYDGWSDTTTISLCPGGIPDDEDKALEKVGYWEWPDENGSVPEEFGIDTNRNVSDSIYGEWDDLWALIAAGKLTPDDVPHESWAIDGGDDTYGFCHAIRWNVYNDDKLYLESERDEYASSIAEDISNGELSAKGLEDAGWYGKEDAKAILDAWSPDYGKVPKWFKAWCKKQMEQSEKKA